MKYQNTCWRVGGLSTSVMAQIQRRIFDMGYDWSSSGRRVLDYPEAQWYFLRDTGSLTKTDENTLPQALRDEFTEMPIGLLLGVENNPFNREVGGI